MRRSRVLVLGAAGVAVAMAARAARADAPTLTWSSRECGASAALFESRLASLVTAEERARLAGNVSVERGAGGKLGVTLSLSLSGTALGERRIDVSSCREAAETAAVTTSLAVFAAADGAAPATSTAAATSVPPASKAPGNVRTVAPGELNRAALPDAMAAPSSRRARPELRVGLFGGVDGGVLPSPSPAIALELGGALGRGSFGLLAAGSAEQEVALASGSARLRAWSAAARACWAPLAQERVRLDACVGARWWWLRGRGQELPVNRAGSLSTLAPLLGAGLALRGPQPFEWLLELELSAPLSRRRFMVGEREVARADAMIWSGRLGPVVRF